MARADKPAPRVSAFVAGGHAITSEPAPRGTALFSRGFRPFFLAAAVWAVLSVAIWLGDPLGGWLPAPVGGLWIWHAHETLFGYGSALIAGFLLTAVPNWTGRRPVAGTCLGVVLALWIVGRAAPLLSGTTGPAAAIAALLDAAFLAVIAALVARHVIAARNRRNLKTVVLTALLAVAGAAYHVELLMYGAAEGSVRLAIASLIGLLMLIAGRMTPIFTRDYLLQRAQDSLPARFDRFDSIALAVAATALVLWVIVPYGLATGFALLTAGLAHSLRLARWQGCRTLGEPLVWVLHVGHAFVALGFLLVGLSTLAPDLISQVAASHAWTAGAIGTIGLGVMTRAARGHSGRSIVASRLTMLSFAACIAAALLRIAAGIAGPAEDALLAASAVAWCGAFALYLIEHWSMLIWERPDPVPAQEA